MTTPPLSRRQVLSLGAALGLLTSCGTRNGGEVRTRLGLATGPEGAVYREIGHAIADLVHRERPDIGIDIRYTDAAWENILLMDEGEVDLMLANIDVAQTEETPAKALGRLFESIFHVIVPKSAEIDGLEDLDGRVIACGQPLSGTRYMAQVIFEDAGIAPTIRDFSQTASMEELARGEVDAVVSLTGMPMPALLNAEDREQYTLLPLGRTVDDVVRARPMHYLPVDVPASMYPGLGSARTLAVPTLLLADPALDEELAADLTGLIFEHTRELSQAHPGAGSINDRTGSATVPIPLHPGAERWFREHKL